MISFKKTFYILIISLLFCLKVESEIKDSLFATVADKAITQSDVINEIKIILILNGKKFSDEDRQSIESAAISSIIKRTIKEIEIEKYPSLKFNQGDINNRIEGLAYKLNLNIEEFNNIFIRNNVDISKISNHIKTELLWNSLIYEKYKNRISINIEEIEEQLKYIKENESLEEFLISEILIKPVAQSEVEAKVSEIENKIVNDGFEQTAITYSISETSNRGGDLGWISETTLSMKFRSILKDTGLGKISEAIFLQEGIMFIKVRDKKKIKTTQTLEEEKVKLINIEQNKILNMYSLSHYDNLKRSITIQNY